MNKPDLTRRPKVQRAIAATNWMASFKKRAAGKRFTFRSRRFKSLVGLIVFCLLLGWFVRLQHASLIRSNFTTGYLLLGCLIFLAMFNLRKKLPMLPRIGSAALWMQLHIYVGLATFFIFGMHVAWRVPTGYFEIVLAALYLTVGISGLLGLIATRLIPKRLTALPEEVIFERIPWLRREIAIEARQLVASVCQSTDVLGRFYVNRLAGYLENPRGFIYNVAPSGKLRRQMIADIEELDRFLVDEQRQASRQLVQLVKRKDDLDYQAVMQGRLKGWLFIHVGLTYSLLIFAVVHLVLVHAFRGGV